MIDLIHGDCLELMKDIPSGSIDAIITDPPYGITDCKWDSVIPFDLMWEQLNRIIKPNGAIVLFGSEPFSSHLRMSNINNYKYDWKWIKNRPSGYLNAKKMPMKANEDIIIFYKIQCTYNRQMVKRTTEEVKRFSKESVITKNTSLYGNKIIKSPNKKDNLFKSPNNTLFFKSVHGRDKTKLKHPTQKPVSLMEYLIKTYTNENELVLDFTMGSGTTMVACRNTNRNGIGIELYDKYFEIATNRMEERELQLF